ncbi:MFS transporter [Streptomyces parvus]
MSAVALSRDFKRLWAGNSVTEFGSQVTMTALPLIAVARLDADGLRIGMLQGLYLIPFFLLALPAGVWLDRAARRPVMVTMDVARAALVATIPLAVVLDSLTWPHLYVVALAGGAMTLLYDIAAAAYVPTLVPPSALSVAHSRMNVNRAVSGTAGPGVTGALAGVIGAVSVLAISVVTFLASALTLASVRGRESPAVPPAPRDPAGATTTPPGRDLIGETREGLRAVFANPPIRCLAVHAALYAGALQLATVSSVIYLLSDVRVSPGWYGAALSLGGVGGVLGTLAAPRILRRSGYRKALLGGIVFATVPFVLVPLATSVTATVVLSSTALFLVGAGSCVVGTSAMTLRHLLTPPALHARMNASYRLLPMAATPAGALLAGVLSEVTGARNTLWFAPVALLASIVPLLAAPLRNLRHRNEVPT